MANQAVLERVERVLAAFGVEAHAARGKTTLAEQIALWAERVQEWNRRIDLTAARNLDEHIDLLLADAAALVGRLAARAERLPESLVDAGSGAGAPGLALALLLPRTRVTLVEPKHKRVAFLRSVLGELERADVSVLRCRVEEVPVHGFTDAISRATLPPPEWLAAGVRVATAGVWVLLAQGEAPALAGWELGSDDSYRWPLTGVERRLLRYRLIASAASDAPAQ